MVGPGSSPIERTKPRQFELCILHVPNLDDFVEKFQLDQHHLEFKSCEILVRNDGCATESSVGGFVVGEGQRERGKGDAAQQ